MKPRMISIDPKVTNTQETVKKLQEAIVSSVGKETSGTNENSNFMWWFRRKTWSRNSAFTKTNGKNR